MNNYRQLSSILTDHKFERNMPAVCGIGAIVRGLLTLPLRNAPLLYITTISGVLLRFPRLAEATPAGHACQCVVCLSYRHLMTSERPSTA